MCVTVHGESDFLNNSICYDGFHQDKTVLVRLLFKVLSSLEHVLFTKTNVIMPHTVVQTSDAECIICVICYNNQNGKGSCCKHRGIVKTNPSLTIIVDFLAGVDSQCYIKYFRREEMVNVGILFRPLFSLMIKVAKNSARDKKGKGFVLMTHEDVLNITNQLLKVSPTGMSHDADIQTLEIITKSTSTGMPRRSTLSTVAAEHSLTVDGNQRMVSTGCVIEKEHSVGEHHMKAYEKRFELQLLNDFSHDTN